MKTLFLAAVLFAGLFLVVWYGVQGIAGEFATIAGLK